MVAVCLPLNSELAGRAAHTCSLLRPVLALTEHAQPKRAQQATLDQRHHIVEIKWGCGRDVRPDQLGALASKLKHLCVCDWWRECESGVRPRWDEGTRRGGTGACFERAGGSASCGVNHVLEVVTLSDADRVDVCRRFLVLVSTIAPHIRALTRGRSTLTTDAMAALAAQIATLQAGSTAATEAQADISKKVRGARDR